MRGRGCATRTGRTSRGGDTQSVENGEQQVGTAAGKREGGEAGSALVGGAGYQRAGGLCDHPIDELPSQGGLPVRFALTKPFGQLHGRRETSDAGDVPGRCAGCAPGRRR